MKGISLVETLVTIGIFGVIIVIVSGIVLSLYKTQNYSWQQSLAIDEARRGVRIMVKEIREARYGDNGAFLLEKAGDKEFVFYSDIDEDGDTEKVRYFLGIVNSGSQTQSCVTLFDGGSCNVSFDNFLQGNLQLASVEVSVEGDFGWDIEYADIYADGQYLGKICGSGCSDCAGAWQGNTVFDVTTLAQDGSIQFTADASSSVDDFCDWQEANHSMKANFVFSWDEQVQGLDHQFKKGVIDPVGQPVVYPSQNEEISILSYYVRNTPPIFEYFDENGDKILNYPARLVDTKVVKLLLVVNVNPSKAPNDFELESYVQLRNIK